MLGVFPRLFQIMDDRWESEVIEFGAINITGFRIVDATRRYVKEFSEGWRRLDPASSPGGGKDTISVSILTVEYISGCPIRKVDVNLLTTVLIINSIFHYLEIMFLKHIIYLHHP